MQGQAMTPPMHRRPPGRKRPMTQAWQAAANHCRPALPRLPPFCPPGGRVPSFCLRRQPDPRPPSAGEETHRRPPALHKREAIHSPQARLPAYPAPRLTLPPKLLPSSRQQRPPRFRTPWPILRQMGQTCPRPGSPNSRRTGRGTPPWQKTGQKSLAWSEAFCAH